MKIKELIEELKKYEQDIEIVLLIEGLDRRYISPISNVEESKKYQAVELKGKLICH